MMKEDKKLLNALAFGDGYIRENGNSYSLCITHCKAQTEYIDYKAKKLSEMLGRNVNVHKFNNSGYSANRIEVCIPYLKFVRKWLYKNGKKRISLPFLRRLSDEGVAIWYMDDGSLIAKKRNGKIHAFDLVISTYCSEQEARDCIQFFDERYGVKFTLKRNKGLFSIRCGTREAKKLLSAINRYIISSMSYKTFRTRGVQ